MKESVYTTIAVVLLLIFSTLDSLLFSRDISDWLWQIKQEDNRRKRATGGCYYS